jgi:hypothetical protein
MPKKVAPEELRDKLILVCVNPREKAEIEERAARSQRSVSSFLRTAGMLVDLSVPGGGQRAA